MTATLPPGRRWASAIATSALVAALGIPAIAVADGTVPEHANENATNGSNGQGCGNLDNQTASPGNPEEQNQGNEVGVGNTACGEQQTRGRGDRGRSDDAPRGRDDDRGGGDSPDNDPPAEDPNPAENGSQDPEHVGGEAPEGDGLEEGTRDEVRDRGNRGRSADAPRGRGNNRSDRSPGAPEHPGTDDTDPANPGNDPEPPVGGEVCPDVLVTFTPGDSAGDGEAVAIVAQALAAGAPGWEFVEWRAAAGTRVSTVVIERGDAIWMERRPGARSGLEEAVQALTICGEVIPAPEGDPIGGEQGHGTSGGQGSSNQGTSPTPTVSPETVVEVSRPESTTTPVVDQRDPEAPRPAADEGTAVRGVVLSRQAPALATAAATTDVVTDDTEVLGVTLARTGIDLAGLAAAGALGLLAGGGVLVATRRRTPREVA